MNANLEHFINDIYDELKDDLPEMSEFALKSVILAKLRDRAKEQADTMIACHLLSEQVKALSVLARM
jgi:hypothetical protein